MKKTNNKKTFWFLGIFIFSALAILAVLSFLALYDKENPGSNFLNVSSINNADTNETSENEEETNDYFLLKNDKNGETIVAIATESQYLKGWGYSSSKQYLNNSNINLILANEIISYGENNDQLIYTFFDKEQYEKCQKQNGNNECPKIRKFVSYNTETGERKTILEKNVVKEYSGEKRMTELTGMQIVDDYLYVLERPTSDGGISLRRPDEQVFRIDLNNPQGYAYLNNGETVGWMKFYENKIYFIDSWSDIYSSAINKISSYDTQNNTIKILWENNKDENYYPEGFSTCAEGFFYKNEYVITATNKTTNMQVYGINLETGKFRFISESKEKFIDSNNKPATEGGTVTSFDNYSKIIFSYEYQPTGLNKIYFYDLEKNTWDSMGNPTIRLATDGMGDDIKQNLENLKSNGFNYANQKINQLYSLYYYTPTGNYDTNNDFLESVYEYTR